MSKFKSTGNISRDTLLAAMYARLPAMMISDPGVGKTATVKSFVKNGGLFEGYTLITLIGSRLDPQDISGFPTRGEVTYTDENGETVTKPITEYAPQKWQDEIMRIKKVILFLDEFSNTHPSVQASFLSLIQDREFPNGDKFPDETIVIGAMNPANSAADAYDLSHATTNRMIWIPWKPDKFEWIEGVKDNWGGVVRSDSEKRWRVLVSKYIQDNPGLLHTMPGTLGDSDGEAHGYDSRDSSELLAAQSAWPSQRSWDNLTKALGQFEKNEAPLIEDSLMQGIIGYRAAGLFRNWLKKHDVLDVADIIKNPRKYPIEKWKKLSLEEINTVLQSALEGDFTEENLYNLIEILRILNSDKVDQASTVAPYLKDIAESWKKVIGATKADKDKYRKEIVSVVMEYKSVITRGYEQRSVNA